MPRAVSRQDKPVGRGHARHRAGAPRAVTRRAPDSSAELSRAFELAALLECSSDAVVGISATGVITGWGDGAARLFGYSPEEALGQPVTMIVPSDRLGEPAALLARALDGERVERHETERIAKGGEPLSVLLSVAPVWGDDHEFVGTVGVFHDLSAQRHAEEAL